MPHGFPCLVPPPCQAGALSSSAFVLPALKDKGWEARNDGTAALAVLLLQDLAVAPLLVQRSRLSRADLADISLSPRVYLACISHISRLHLALISLAAQPQFQPQPQTRPRPNLPLRAAVPPPSHPGAAAAAGGARVGGPSLGGRQGDAGLRVGHRARMVCAEKSLPGASGAVQTGSGAA